MGQQQQQQQQQQSHEQQQHYVMSPHLDGPHMSTTPQPLPPMSSFRGGSTNGQPNATVSGGNSGPSNPNPALYNPSLSHHSQHNMQNDTLVGKALQTVSNKCFVILGMMNLTLTLFSDLS